MGKVNISLLRSTGFNSVRINDETVLDWKSCGGMLCEDKARRADVLRALNEPIEQESIEITESDLKVESTVQMLLFEFWFGSSDSLRCLGELLQIPGAYYETEVQEKEFGGLHEIKIFVYVPLSYEEEVKETLECYMDKKVEVDMSEAFRKRSRKAMEKIEELLEVTKLYNSIIDE